MKKQFGILTKNVGKTYVKDLEVSTTVLARDWKGLTTYGSTCVVEIEDEEEESVETEDEVEPNKNIRPNRLFNIYGENKGTGFAGNVWDTNAISPTITTAQGGNRQPLIIVYE